MRAFAGMLERYNASYSAQYISSDHLNEILNNSNSMSDVTGNGYTDNGYRGNGYKGSKK